jgi:hypothetical protein
MIMIDWEWHTLSELHILTGDPEASVSARLRDLRKKKFGGYDVLRRRVLGLKIYEYRVVEPAGGA